MCISFPGNFIFAFLTYQVLCTYIQATCVCILKIHISSQMEKTVWLLCCWCTYLKVVVNYVLRKNLIKFFEQAHDHDLATSCTRLQKISTPHCISFRKYQNKIFQPCPGNIDQNIVNQFIISTLGVSGFYIISIIDCFRRWLGLSVQGWKYMGDTILLST